MIGMTKDVVCGEHVYVVRELTVIEIRNWIGQLDASNIDVVDELLIEKAQLSAVRLMAGITKDDMDQMPPSVIGKIVDAAKTVNPHFFAMLDKVVSASRPQRPGSS